GAGRELRYDHGDVGSVSVARASDRGSPRGGRGILRKASARLQGSIGGISIMAIGVIATLKVQREKGSELEAVFNELAAKVRSNERGNRLYQLCRHRKEADTYVVMEIYDDQAAIEAHGKSEHFRAAGPAIGACLAGRPDIQYLETI